jgi:hypothetical protein
MFNKNIYVINPLSIINKEEKMFNKNKKAQVGDTVTWIIATIIILVMIFFFVLGSSLLSETKKIVGYKSGLFSDQILYQEDLYLSKSLYSYYKVSNSKDKTLFYENIKKLPLEEGSSETLEKRSSEIRRKLG